jgi:mono/diheme cytochrome c family protein
VLVGVVAVLVLLVGGVSAFVATFKPKQRAASTEAIERTPARLERGKYLVEAVLGCMDCHSAHDMSRFGLPATGPAGAGGPCLGKAAGMPGEICPSNITPDPETGLGNWTDGEILRAVREGVSRDGRALFPMMPYGPYSALSDEDARAVVAYLRTLPPARNAVPASRVDFPVSFFIKMAPRPLEGPVADPSPQDAPAMGRYLTTVSGCQFCHTPVDAKHESILAEEFSGGQEFTGPWGVVRAANLTPHATGLGDRDQAAFVGLFKAFAVPAADLPQVPIAQNTSMPWLTRALMTEADLGTIYTYLRTRKPIERTVEKRPLPAMPGLPTAANPPGASPPAATPPAAAP